MEDFEIVPYTSITDSDLLLDVKRKRTRLSKDIGNFFIYFMHHFLPRSKYPGCYAGKWFYCMVLVFKLSQSSEIVLQS